MIYLAILASLPLFAVLGYILGDCWCYLRTIKKVMFLSEDHRQRFLATYAEHGHRAGDGYRLWKEYKNL